MIRLEGVGDWDFWVHCTWMSFNNGCSRNLELRLFSPHPLCFIRFGTSYLMMEIQITYKDIRGTQYISSTSDFPNTEESPHILSIEEPMIRLTLIVPNETIGSIISLLLDRRGIQQELSMIDANRTLLRFRLPLAEMIVDFFDTVQGISSGFVTYVLKSIS